MDHVVEAYDDTYLYVLFLQSLPILSEYVCFENYVCQRLSPLATGSNEVEISA